MRRFLICLSVLVTLCHTDEKEENLYLRTGEKTGASSQDGFIKSGKDEIGAEIAKRNANTTNREGESNEKKENKSARNELDADNKNTSKTVMKERESNERLNDTHFMKGEVESDEHLVFDPVMDVKQRADSSSDPVSSSMELQDWMEEWKELWNKRKQETKNFSTYIKGDSVYTIAARPWGVPCGDPAQHDKPWGTCMLAVECNADFRIYKGDYFCGRTQFVCCSLNFHNYDLYQGLDASFGQSSMELDSAEERERAKKQNCNEKQKRKSRARKRRKRLREERKRKIKRTISKIVKEVQRVLERASRNGSNIRKKKTKTMKKFIKYLKKQYKLNRESAKDIHDQQLVEVDQDFMNKLMQIKELNKDFMTNDTFRNIVLNRTMSLRTAKWLAKSYPQLEGYLPMQMYNRGDTRQIKEKAPRIGDYRRRGDSLSRRRYLTRRRGNWARQREHVKRGNARLRGGIMRPIAYDVEYIV